MKRWIVILLCLVLVFAMIGCGNSISPGKPGSNQPAETDTQNQQNIDSQETQAPEPLSEPSSDSIPSDSMDAVDVDLTVLSSTMVYSEVYNMLASPDQYIGKTVKMDGLFTYYYDKPTGNYYFACIIQDATACCAQGIEFVLTDEYSILMIIRKPMRKSVWSVCLIPMRKRGIHTVRSERQNSFDRITHHPESI